MTFEVFDLDMIPDGIGMWTENDRFPLGRITVPADDLYEVTDVMLLRALSEHKIGHAFGRDCFALTTTDRRRLYVEDLYADGSWFEVGLKKGREPIIGLKPIEASVSKDSSGC